MKHFFSLFFQGILGLLRNPWSLCMTITAVTLVAFLGSIFLLFLFNIEKQVSLRSGNVQFQVFWNSDVDAEILNKCWKDIEKKSGVISVTPFTPDSALTALEDSFQNADLSWLKGNSPLPATALVDCILPDVRQKEWAENMVKELKALSGVARVSFNPLQLDMLSSWIQLTRKAFLPVAISLLVIIGLVVGNTIKLSLLMRRDELEILRFIGASPLYIQFPLLVGGAVQGFSGGFLALGLLKLVQQNLDKILNTPPLWISISFVPEYQSIIFLSSITFVGLVSSKIVLRG